MFWKRKRTMSAEARKRIGDTHPKRWREWKVKQRKRLSRLRTFLQSRFKGATQFFEEGVRLHRHGGLNVAPPHVGTMRKFGTRRTHTTSRDFRDFLDTVP